MVPGLGPCPTKLQTELNDQSPNAVILWLLLQPGTTPQAAFHCYDLPLYCLSPLLYKVLGDHLSFYAFKQGYFDINARKPRDHGCVVIFLFILINLYLCCCSSWITLFITNRVLSQKCEKALQARLFIIHCYRFLCFYKQSHFQRVEIANFYIIRKW